MPVDITSQSQANTIHSFVKQSLQTTPLDSILLGCAALKYHLSEKILPMKIIDSTIALECELLKQLQQLKT